MKGIEHANFYRRIIAAMRMGVKKMPRQEKKRSEATLQTMSATNRYIPPEEPAPVVTTKVPTLAGAVNDAVGTFETQAIVGGDKSKEKFIGLRKQPEKEKQKPKVKPKNAKDVAAMTMEEAIEEERLEVETDSEVRHMLRKKVCRDEKDPAGSWFRAITTLISATGDYSFTTDVTRMVTTLIEGIPQMREASKWSQDFFGADDQKFIKFLKAKISDRISINMEEPAEVLICAATAKLLSRTIKIHTVDTLRAGEEPLTMDGGLDSSQRTPLEILFHKQRFWALVDTNTEEDELLEDPEGMQGPSQSRQGKYRIHKVKGPTLPMKGKNAGSKAKRDEKRRRDEKAKSELEVKVDALNELTDSLKADAGSLKDKLRQVEDYAAAQRKYIMSLEIRFSDLCTGCKQKTPPTAFTAPERESIMNIVRMLESQQEMITSMLNSSGRQTQPPTQPDSGPETVAPAAPL